MRTGLHLLLRQTWSSLSTGAGGPIALATGLLLLWQTYGYPADYILWFDELIGPWRYRQIAPSLYWSASNVVMLLLTPWLAARWIWGLRPRSLGFGLGDRKLGLTVTAVAYAVMLPVVVVASSWADFRGTYPLDADALRSHEFFWVYELGYMGFFVGWEFFFRGFLLFTLESFLGPAAIAVQMIPFALLHVGKPLPEALGSIVAGVFLGALAWRTRSIWYGVALHAAVALSMDIAVYLRWGPGSP